MKRDIRRVVGPLAVIAIVFLTGILLYSSFGPVVRSFLSNLRKPAERNTEVRLATSKNLWCALSLIALEKKYFEEEGLDVKPNYQVAGRYNMDALLAKSVEIANVVEVNLAYQALNGNREIRIPASIVAARDFAIITRANSGIQSPSDLTGRALAFSPGTGAEMFVFSLLEDLKISPEDITLQRVQPSALADMLAAGGVDAAASWEPFVSTMKGRLGSDAVEFYDPKVFKGVMNVAVREDWLRMHRPVMIRFIRALVRAEDLIEEDPLEAQRVVALATGIDEGTVRSIWNRFDFQVSLDPEAQRTLHEDVIKMIAANEENYQNREVPDLRPYFDGSLLNEVRAK